jgi:hypothetical protein
MVVKKRETRKKLTSMASLARKQDRKSSVGNNLDNVLLARY